MGDGSPLFVVEVPVDRIVGHRARRSIGAGIATATTQELRRRCLDRSAPARFATRHVQCRARTVRVPAPLGSWPRTYAATIAVAIAVIALLWLLTTK